MSIEIYSTKICPYCVKAKKLLISKGVSFTEYFVDDNDIKRDEMMKRSNHRTVPQIFINDQHIGGCDDLYVLDAKGELDLLLSL